MIGFAQSIVTILLFILILGALVLIHELGHFVTARWANVRVLEFGIGFPPRAKVLGRGKPDPRGPRAAGDRARAPAGDRARHARGRRVPRDGGASSTPSRQGTLYTLNWLPIGGFVKLEGEDGDNANDPRAFSRARLPVKLGILVAGVADEPPAGVRDLHGPRAVGRAADRRHGSARSSPGAPAAASGLVAGDTIVTINGTRYSAFGNPEQAIDDLQANGGQTVMLGIQHADGTTERRPRHPADARRGSSRARSGSAPRPSSTVGTIDNSFVRGGPDSAPSARSRRSA